MSVFHADTHTHIAKEVSQRVNIYTQTRTQASIGWESSHRVNVNTQTHAL